MFFRALVLGVVTPLALHQVSAMAVAAFNNENRLRDEANLAAFFKEQGLEVYSPKVDAFRTRVQKAYSGVGSLDGLA